MLQYFLKLVKFKAHVYFDRLLKVVGFFWLSSLISGVFILVIAYTVMGSILFVSLEGDLEESDGIETAVAASKPYPRNNEANNAELRTR